MSVALLWWALHDVSLAELEHHLRSARLGPLLAAVAVATSVFALRVVRWGFLLRRADGAPLPPGALWHAVAIGFAANNLLPFRAGELIRAWTASRLGGVRMSAALSSVVVERVFDGLTLVALLTVALLSPGVPEGAAFWGMPLEHIATVAGLIFGGALAVAVAFLVLPVAAERLVRSVTPERMAERLVSLLEGFREGLSVLGSPRRILGAVSWSLVLWLVNAWSFHLAFAAFGLEVPFTGALLLQGVLAFGIAIPTAPGYVGAFELVIRAVLQLYGTPADLAVSYALAYHVTTFIPITLLGLWSLWRSPIALGELRSRPVANA